MGNHPAYRDTGLRFCSYRKTTEPACILRILLGVLLTLVAKAAFSNVLPPALTFAGYCMVRRRRRGGKTDARNQTAQHM